MTFLRPALLLALTALSTLSCGFLYDFDGYGVKQEGSGGSGGGGGQDEAGGVGGAGGCDGSNVSSDPLNCGACSVDCAGGACNDGICSPVGLPIGQVAATVALLGEQVFAVRGDANGAALITLPIDFNSQTQPGLNKNVCDPSGFISVGGGRAHYRPQNPAGCPMGTFIFSCDTTSCGETAYGLMGHINGLIVVKSNVYFAVGTQIYIAELSPEGIPSMSTTLWVAEMASGGQGAYLIDYEAQGDVLWWTTFSAPDGCVYMKPRQSSPEASVSCFAQSVTRPGTFLISPSGEMYVESLTTEHVPIEVFKFNPAAPSDIGLPFFASTTLKLFAADNDYVYVYDGADPKSLVLLRHTTGEERARMPVLGPISGLDAQHSDYVFFTSAGSLYRLRKPLP